ncbi:MAG TPA: altronate dehydratase, partial [Clostridia bacterium]
LVPTIKVASNTRLAAWKQAWIDFDAGPLLDGADMEDLSSRLYALILEVADGQKTKSELSGYKEIGIFKSGVTL